MPAAHFAWYELMTADARAAIDFHTQGVGWQAQDAGMPGTACTLMMVGDARVAGPMSTPPELLAGGAPFASMAKAR